MVDGERVEIAFDLYPTTFEVQSTTYHEVRALVANGYVYAYKMTGSGPTALYEKPVIGVPTGSEGVGIAVETEDGVIWIQRSGGCACGARIQNIDLFPGRQKVLTGVRRQGSNRRR